MSAEAQMFTEIIKSWDAEKLLLHYGNARIANKFGSHDEEIAIVKAEILSRMS